MRRSLELAAERGLRTIAVPAIGAGVAGFPLQRAAEILLEEVRFVLFGEPAYRVFEMVNDAAKVAEQMARLASREPRS